MCHSAMLTYVVMFMRPFYLADVVICNLHGSWMIVDGSICDGDMDDGPNLYSIACVCI